MAQTGNRRVRQVYALHSLVQAGLWEQWRVEERFEALCASQWMGKIRRGLPVFALCALSAQGKLVGGASPFAPALLAAVMMCDCQAGWAAAGCALGALIAWEPAVLMVCIVLYVLNVCLRAAELRPNDLTCIAAVGLAQGLLPLIFAQTAYDQLMTLAGAAASMVLAGLLTPALRLRTEGRELFSTEERIGVAVLIASVLSGLRGVQLWGASPAVAALMLLCLAAGYLGGMGAGAAMGALTGLLVCVTQPAAQELLCGFVWMGLMCGLFSRMGRWWTAAAAPLACVLAAAMDPQFLSLERAAELAAAMLVFLCIRERTWQRLRVYIKKDAQVRAAAELSQAELRGALRDKLCEYAGLYHRMERYPGGGQFAAVGTALERMAEELSQPVAMLPELSATLAQALDAAGIAAQNVCASTQGEKLCIRLQIACKRRDGLCDGRVMQIASRTAGMPMRVRPTGLCPKEGMCMLELEAANRYEVAMGCASNAQEDGQPCGDTLTTVQLPEGRYLLALADGMGHGSAARFEPEDALHGVNEMLLRSGMGERFSTMDLALLDLGSGNLRAMKIGAVPSFIRRGKHVIRIGGDALPMGIMERIKPSVTQMQLQDGDVLLMLSDGILDAVGGEEGWLQTQLLSVDIRAPETAARKILQSAQKVGRHRDDMTVCLVRVIARR